MNIYPLAKSPHPLPFNIYIICWSTEFEDRKRDLTWSPWYAKPRAVVFPSP